MNKIDWMLGEAITDGWQGLTKEDIKAVLEGSNEYEAILTDYVKELEREYPD